MIELITPSLRNYRLELFEKIIQDYLTKFIFTSQESGEYGGIVIPESWSHEEIDITLSQAFNVINWLRFARSLLKDDYELVIVSPAEKNYNFLAFILSKLRSKKIVFWGECWNWPSNKIHFKLYYFFVKLFLERADAIIAMGKKQSIFYRSIQNKTKVIFAPNYVVSYRKRSCSKLFKTLSAKDPKILGKKIALYMGRIIKRKGLDYLIRAFKIVEDKYDDVYLIVAGSGKFSDYCKKLAVSLDVKNVLFTGYVKESDVELYYNICDVFVLPSIFLNEHPEPAGYSVYEFMSVGKPVIVTDAVGARELVMNGVNGFVVKEKNVNELADALSKIVSDEVLQKKMCDKSKQIFMQNISLEGQFEAFKVAIDSIKQRA
jgi:glycosyltransferase involved in cell wall biosynthesis